MTKIKYQCSNCGVRFTSAAIPGVPDGMFYSGCRVVGDAFYCEDCVKTWKDRNGKEFDEQYKNPAGMFAKWWNNTVERQTKDKSKLKKYRHGAFEEYVEV